MNNGQLLSKYRRYKKDIIPGLNCKAKGRKIEIRSFGQYGTLVLEKWVNYWVVIRGFQLFFYKDQNTHINDNIQFHLDIGAKSNFVSGKTSKNKFEFEVKVERSKKYLLRANTEADRLQWVYTLGLAAQGKPPPTSFCDPDPGDLSNNSEKTVTKSTSNQYTEVPNFCISPDVAGLTDEEMQRKAVNNKKHNSFSSYCKNLVGLKDKRNSKSVNSEESSQPEPVQAKAEAEAYYDPFPGSKPPWYFGKVTRENAEKILQEHPTGSYLVRDSETVTKPGAYTISLKHREKFRHHKVETLQDGNLVIKTHEDKVFPNLGTLMNYFTKSQEREILMAPVYCKDQVDNDVKAVQPGFESNDPRPPVPGCEDRPSRPESSSGEVSPGASTKHSYENLPDKPKAKPPLISRVTSPDLCKTRGYENIPNKDKRPVGNRTPPPDHPPGYEFMNDKGACTPAPALPPRRPPPKVSGYENLPSKGAEPLPSREPSCEGYVNLPARQDRPSNGPPPLPPKTPSQGLQGYENIPTRVGSSLRSRSLPYENIATNGRPRYSQGSMLPNSSAGRQPAPFRRSATVPDHIIQNTLEKGIY